MRPPRKKKVTQATPRVRECGTLCGREITRRQLADSWRWRGKERERKRSNGTLFFGNSGKIQVVDSYLFPAVIHCVWVGEGVGDLLNSGTLEAQNDRFFRGAAGTTPKNTEFSAPKNSLLTNEVTGQLLPSLMICQPKQAAPKSLRKMTKEEKDDVCHFCTHF